MLPTIIWIAVPIAVVVFFIWLGRRANESKETSSDLASENPKTERKRRKSRKTHSSNLQTEISLAEIDRLRKERQAENDAYRKSEGGYFTNWDN
jgi:hypothetical protein